MNTCTRHAKLTVAAFSILVASLLSGCGSSGGCTVVPSGATSSGAAAQGPHCAGEAATPPPGQTASSTPSYSISGGVSGGKALGVLISLTGAAIANTTTDSGGNYSFTGLAGGNYTLMPSLTSYTFNPASIVVTVSGESVSGYNFKESPYIGATSNLSGAVGGAVTQDVLITLSGDNAGTALTDANGSYGFVNLAAGGYTVTPSLAGYIFKPASRAVTTTTAGVGNAAGNSFTASVYAAPTSSLSGAVSGAVVQNVVMTLSGPNTGSAVTDASGKYSFSGLAAGNYTVTPSLAGYFFIPAKSAITTIGGGNVTVSDFTATK